MGEDTRVTSSPLPPERVRDEGADWDCLPSRDQGSKPAPPCVVDQEPGHNSMGKPRHRSTQPVLATIVNRQRWQQAVLANEDNRQHWQVARAGKQASPPPKMTKGIVSFPPPLKGVVQQTPPLLLVGGVVEACQLPLLPEALLGVRVVEASPLPPPPRSPSGGRNGKSRYSFSPSQKG